jgi:hypothetical protein
LDWTLAITRNRDQLKGIVLGLFVLAKMRVNGSLFTLPRSTLAAIMLVLRPAESAVRRLIVIAAHGLVAKSQPTRPFVILGHRPEDPAFAIPGAMGRTCAFKLFDPLKSFDPEAIWDNDQVTYESGYGLTTSTIAHDTSRDHQPVDATHLGQRLNALIRALDNLPHQARRLVRWQKKRDALLKVSKPTRISPIRPGLPPGWRERKLHEIDDVLRECHGLAHDRLNGPDSS